ncbi:MAG: ABC transporter substrate-binding protein [Muribaculaceae bacterium]|nr:ABC transporter substrate-binding protein [Muribaculaceae bacterium]MDE7368369.1 ABC transporter substrate-binding protein [Muribaculaceae bacterium]
MAKKFFLSYSVSCLVALLLLPACGGAGGATAVIDGGDTIPMDYAKRLTIVDYPDYTYVSIQNPWDTTKTLHSYLLVPDSTLLPEGLPSGTVIRTPLKRSIVHSSIHCRLIEELGAGTAIKGVCDAQYMIVPEIKDGIKSGTITDCGINTSPDIEKVVELNPDAILLSPYQDSGAYGKLATLPIPIVECADYMEISPLARAEWIKFFGRLYGQESKADSIFEAVKTSYNSLKEKTKDIASRPEVLLDRLYGRQWFVPVAESTIATLIRDAGGLNPFDNIESSGSVALSAEQVLVEAGDAPVWIVRYLMPNPMTLQGLKSENKIYSQFDAYKSGNVYGCNTSEILLFEDSSFHPERALSDLINIIHPELSNSTSTQYFFTKLDEK